MNSVAAPSSCHCLGLGCDFCDAAKLRAERAALQATCKVERGDASWTHVDYENTKFKMSAEQARADERLFHKLWLLTDGDAESLQPRTESISERMSRCDAAVRDFLNSEHIIQDSTARVSHADFAAACKRYNGLRNLSQHAISQAARRAGLKALASHANRFWVGIRYDPLPEVVSDD
jgi:hypothetical protein